MSIASALIPTLPGAFRSARACPRKAYSTCAPRPRGSLPSPSHLRRGGSQRAFGLQSGLQDGLQNAQLCSNLAQRTQEGQVGQSCGHGGFLLAVIAGSVVQEGGDLLDGCALLGEDLELHEGVLRKLGQVL